MAPDPNPIPTPRYFCVPPASDLQYLPRVGSFSRQQRPFGRSVDTEVRMTQECETCHAKREWLAEREADITCVSRRLLQLVDPELPVESDEPPRDTVRRVLPDMPEATLPVDVHVEGAGMSSEAAIFADTPTTSAPTSPQRVEPVDVTFTTLGTEGHTGPTRIGAHYDGMRLEGKVTLVEGYQRWKVPYTRRYRIEAHRAASHPQRCNEVCDYFWHAGNGAIVHARRLSAASRPVSAYSRRPTPVQGYWSIANLGGGGLQACPNKGVGGVTNRLKGPS